jgi:hypothetical protein
MTPLTQGHLWRFTKGVLVFQVQVFLEPELLKFILSWFLGLLPPPVISKIATADSKSAFIFTKRSRLNKKEINSTVGFLHHNILHTCIHIYTHDDENLQVKTTDYYKSLCCFRFYLFLFIPMHSNNVYYLQMHEQQNVITSDINTISK